MRRIMQSIGCVTLFLNLLSCKPLPPESMRSTLSSDAELDSDNAEPEPLCADPSHNYPGSNNPQTIKTITEADLANIVAQSDRIRFDPSDQNYLLIRKPTIERFPNTADTPPQGQNPTDQVSEAPEVPEAETKSVDSSTTSIITDKITKPTSIPQYDIASDDLLDQKSTDAGGDEQRVLKSDFLKSVNALGSSLGAYGYKGQTASDSGSTEQVLVAYDPCENQHRQDYANFMAQLSPSLVYNEVVQNENLTDLANTCLTADPYCVPPQSPREESYNWGALIEFTTQAPVAMTIGDNVDGLSLTESPSISASSRNEGGFGERSLGYAGYYLEKGFHYNPMELDRVKAFEAQIGVEAFFMGVGGSVIEFGIETTRSSEGDSAYTLSSAILGITYLQISETSKATAWSGDNFKQDKADVNAVHSAPKNEERTIPRDAHSERGRDSTRYQTSIKSIFLVGPVPVGASFGVEAGLSLSFAIATTHGLGIVFTPSIAVGAYLQLGVDLVFMTIGIKGSLGILSLDLPITAGLNIELGSGQAAPSLDLVFRADISLSALSGSISFIASLGICPFFCTSFVHDLVAYDGIEIPLGFDGNLYNWDFTIKEGILTDLSSNVYANTAALEHLGQRFIVQSRLVQELNKKREILNTLRDELRQKIQIRDTLKSERDQLVLDYNQVVGSIPDIADVNADMFSVQNSDTLLGSFRQNMLE